MQGFQQPGALSINPYSAPQPGVPAGPPGTGGQPLGSYLQAPYRQQLQQPAAPAIPGVQSTSLYLGFEAAPDFNVAQRLKGPSKCSQPISASCDVRGFRNTHFQLHDFYLQKRFSPRVGL